MMKRTRGSIINRGSEIVAQALIKDNNVKVTSRGREFYNSNNFPIRLWLYHFLISNVKQPRPYSMDISVVESIWNVVLSQKLFHNRNEIVLMSVPEWVDQAFLDKLDGGLLHEIFHTLYTETGRSLDFRHVSKVLSASYRQDVPYYKYKDIMFYINNIFEDHYIERKGLEAYKGACKKLQATQNMIWDREREARIHRPLGEPFVDSKGNMRNAFNAHSHMTGYILANLKSDYLKCTILDEFDENIRKLVDTEFKDILVESRRTQNSYDVLKITFDYINKLHDLQEQEEEKEEEPESENQQQSKSEKEKEVGNGDSSKSEECSGESTSQDRDDEADIDEDGDGGNGERSDDETSGDSEQSESVPDEGDIKGDEEDEDGEGESVPEKENQNGNDQNGDGGEGQLKDDDTQDMSDADSESTSDSGSGNDDIEGESKQDSEYESRCDGEDNPESGQDSQEFGGEMDEDGVDYTDNASQPESGSLKEALILLNDSDGSLAELLDIAAALQQEWDDSISEHVSDLPFPYTREYDKEVIVKDTLRNEKKFKSTEQEVRQSILFMKPRFQSFFRGKDNVRVSHKEERGRRLSPRTIASVVYKEKPKPFMKTYESVSKNSVVSLCVDESGSMSSMMGRVQHSVLSIALTLASLKVPLEISGFSSGTYYPTNVKFDQLNGFTRSSNVIYNIYKQFDEPNNIKSQMKICSMADRELTPLPDAIEWSANRLARRKEDQKVLFVITDGYPCYGGASSLSEEDYLNIMKNQVDLYKQWYNIDIMFLGIGGATFVDRYPNSMYIKSSKSMGQDMAKFLLEQMKRIVGG